MKAAMKIGEVSTFVVLSVLLTLVVLGLAHNSFEFEERELETEDTLWELYERWSEHFKVSRDPSEKQMRFSLFKDKAKYILEFNKKNVASREMELSKFSDMTQSEVQEFVTCYDQSDDDVSVDDADDFNMYRNNLQVPASIDWRSRGAVTTPKNQGVCSSCWAFSAAATVEGINQIRTGTLLELSPQQLIDCNKASKACCGGSAEKAFRYIKSSIGLTTETNYPYVCRSVRCNNGTNNNRTCETAKVRAPLVTITGHVRVAPNNETALKEAVANQPVSVKIDAGGVQFQNYKAGTIFLGPCGTGLNHVVTIVGYGTRNGTDYWIVKNSWGSNWGDQGYIFMQRGVSAKEGLCAIAVRPSYPTK